MPRVLAVPMPRIAMKARPRARRRSRRLVRCMPVLGLGLATLIVPAARAQEAAGRSVQVSTQFTAQQTFTDNVNLSATDKRSDAITELRPGIRLSSRSGRVQGNLDYSLGALIHARDSSLNELQNNLDAAVAAEVVEQHLFVDARVGISQQTISAFGTQVGNTGLANDNQTDVINYGATAAWRSRLGDTADATASLGWSGSQADSTSLGDGDSLDAAIGLSGGQGRFGWGLDAGWQTTDFRDSEEFTTNQVFGTLRFAPDPDLQLSVRGGIEGEGLRTGTRETDDFWGWGASWQPGPRTSLSWQTDHRFFGRSHDFSFQHRFVRAFFSYTDSRGTNDASGQGDPLNRQRGSGQSRSLTTYDIFFAQFASLEPDPAKRDQFVRAFLQANGLDPNATVGGGFLSSGKTLESSQNLSVGYTAIRTTFTLSGFRSETEPLDENIPVGGDLSNVGRVRQVGFSAGASHRLTPTAALSLTGNQTRTLDEPGQAGSETRTLSLFLSDSLGRRTNGSIGVRHSRFDSDSAPYRESAIVGSVSIQF
jgi:uncharacterized protein (PEP-CTERM system associated)